MSPAKILIGVVVLIVILGGAYWFMKKGSHQAPEQATNTETTQQGDSIDTTLTAIDGQISAFDADNASVSAGLSDQPVSQSSI